MNNFVLNILYLQDGLTCLHVAKSRDVVLMLIKNGAHLDIQNVVQIIVLLCF